MQLTSVKISRFRSISKEASFAVSDLTVLVGPNNQGKSNLLHGISLGMKVIEELALNRPHVAPRPENRRAWRMSRTSSNPVAAYDWERDYPLGSGRDPKRSTSTVRFEFSLSPEEISDFYTEVGSRVNGSLPIVVTFQDGRRPSLTIPKRGPGKKTYAQKSAKIAKFVQERVKFIYVPAIRTVSQTLQVINHLAEERLAMLEADMEYQSLLDKIEAKRSMHYRELEKSISERLQSYLPGFQSVEVLGEPLEQIGDVSDIRIDDGVATSLLHKGDGVKSIVSLAMLHDLAEHTNKDKQVILAVEEPEAHLHPHAVHEIRKVLAQVATEQQVIVTTHSPLLINRLDIGGNILVHSQRARAAKRIAELRECLGVRQSDNLSSASFALLVEGMSDERVFRCLLSESSSILRRLIGDGQLVIQSTGGGNGIETKAKHLLAEPAIVVAVVDGDNAGNDTLRALTRDHLVPVENIFRLTPDGRHNKELEDLFTPEFHRSVLSDMFSVSCETYEPWSDEKKWSTNTKAFLRRIGRPDDTPTMDKVKEMLASKVEEVGSSALSEAGQVLIDSIASRLEALAKD